MVCNNEHDHYFGHCPLIWEFLNTTFQKLELVLSSDVRDRRFLLRRAHYRQLIMITSTVLISPASPTPATCPIHQTSLNLRVSSSGIWSRIVRWVATCLLAGFAEPISSTLKIKAICSSETSVKTQRTTRRHIPEDDTLHNHRCENLKSYFLNLISWKRLYLPLGYCLNMVQKFGSYFCLESYGGGSPKLDRSKGIARQSQHLV
jgi:hypothetical protein